jgi:SAM-dependent methyltransferase
MALRPSHPASSPPWYQTAFGHDYLTRYAHRSDADAAEDARFLARVLDIPAGSCVLDLCCGAGRYSRALARAGFRVVGVDLSRPLLAEALRSRVAPTPFYLRADARHLPLRTGAFDGAANLFTSFGYFESDAEDLAVLRAVARVLKPRRLFVLDFLNLASTLAGLVAHSERTVKGARFIEERRYDATSRRLLKTVRPASAGAQGHEVSESVRAYAPAELEALFRRTGFTVVERFGDLHGAPLDEQASPRCVLVGRKDPA